LGFIIGTFAIFYIISSVITGRNLSRIGRPNGLKFGMAGIIIQLIMMGCLEYIESIPIFIGISFLAMTIGGIGGGLNSTCAMAIITSMFPNEKELYIGILEAAVGIGLLIGPLLGAFLYSVGGFKLPFWTVAAICITLYPLLIHTNKFIV